MARTSRGNYTGQAARLERLDLYEEIRLKSLRFQEAFLDAIDKLKELDPDGWSAWYDSCPQKTHGEMLPVIRERIELLEQLAWLNENIPSTAA
jgi:hypothetical protein